MTVDPAALLTLIDRGGVVAVLVLIIAGSLRGWWVPGWLYRQDAAKAQSEVMTWRGLALNGTDLAKRAVTLVPEARP